MALDGAADRSMAEVAEGSSLSLFHMMTRDDKVAALQSERDQMIEYLRLKVDKQDWHGVQDAASDLRDIDAEIEGLKFTGS